MIQEIEGRQIRNRILRSVAPDLLPRLSASWECIALAPQEVLKRAGEVPRHLYFVNSGLVSYVKPMEDGRTVEIDAVGRDGIVGIFALHNRQPSIWDAVVQIPGHAVRIGLAVLREAMEHDDGLRRLLQRCLYLMAGQLAQNAACNRLHSMEQRCARRLLVAHDNVASDTISLTHESLALTLGVHRAGLSMTAAALQRQGLIRYTRGRVRITDRAGLEAVACECYRTVLSHRRRTFGNSGHRQD